MAEQGGEEEAVRPSRPGGVKFQILTPKLGPKLKTQIHKRDTQTQGKQQQPVEGSAREGKHTTTTTNPAENNDGGGAVIDVKKDDERCGTANENKENTQTLGESVSEGKHNTTTNPVHNNDGDDDAAINVEKDDDGDRCGTKSKENAQTDSDGDVKMTEKNEATETNSNLNGKEDGKTSSSFDPRGNNEHSEHDYELIDGEYYYSDKATGKRYRYDGTAQDWVEVFASEGDRAGGEQKDAGSEAKDGKSLVDSSKKHDGTDDQSVTTDSEGRTYYYADSHYLCRDKDGNVFYLGEGNEWKPWGGEGGNDESSKWYFCQGNSTFYRDKLSGVVYRLNQDSNEWQEYEGKLKKKRPLIDDEEFDTEDDDDDSDDGGGGGGAMPPGAKEDPNISYDGTTYTKVDPVDNMKYEWDTQRRAWFPKLDEDFMATYQLSYGFNPDGTKNENPLKFDDDEEEAEARREAEELKRKQEKEAAKTSSKKQSWFEMDETRNTKVYVSNLPENTTENTFMTLMQKCGMIMLDEKTSRPKIKLYKDDQGNFKGDALCTYIKVESVKLAEQILDGYEVGRRKIRVEPARFEQKGAYNPKLKPRKKGKKELEKIKKKQEKLFDWRPEPMRGERKKNENTVVIRNVFDPKEFEVAMDKILDHKEAMRSQASNFGKIKKLELYDLHPEGVVQVTFEEVESADMCVATLHKRLYCGRTLYVTTWDGREKFKIEETPAEREERIKKWNEFLESEASSSK